MFIDVVDITPYLFLIVLYRYLLLTEYSRMVSPQCASGFCGYNQDPKLTKQYSITMHLEMAIPIPSTLVGDTHHPLLFSPINYVEWIRKNGAAEQVSTLFIECLTSSTKNERLIN
jgi:hypothetical protein